MSNFQADNKGCLIVHSVSLFKWKKRLKAVIVIDYCQKEGRAIQSCRPFLSQMSCQAEARLSRQLLGGQPLCSSHWTRDDSHNVCGGEGEQESGRCQDPLRGTQSKMYELILLFPLIFGPWLTDYD